MQAKTGRYSTFWDRMVQPVLLTLNTDGQNEQPLSAQALLCGLPSNMPACGVSTFTAKRGTYVYCALQRVPSIVSGRNTGKCTSCGRHYRPSLAICVMWRPDVFFVEAINRWKHEEVQQDKGHRCCSGRVELQHLPVEMLSKDAGPRDSAYISELHDALTT